MSFANRRFRCFETSKPRSAKVLGDSEADSTTEAFYKRFVDEIFSCTSISVGYVLLLAEANKGNDRYDALERVEKTSIKIVLRPRDGKESYWKRPMGATSTIG